MVSNKPFGEQTGNRPEQGAGGRFAEQVQRSGGRIGERLRETGQNIAREQKNRACEELETISEVVHEAADRLHERDDHIVADYADALADQIEKAAEYIRDHSVSDMVDSVNDFARRRPEILIGGALVAGLAVARFLKASKQAGQQQHSGQGQAWPQSMRGSTHGQGEAGGFETRTSEAGPIATAPRRSPGGTPGTGGIGSVGGQGEEVMGTAGSVGGTGGREQHSGRVVDQPHGIDRSSETPRAVSESDARQAGRGLEGAGGSRMADENNPIGERETPLRDRESQQQQRRSEDNK